jgi:D-alanine-D-alanine ligase
MTDQLIDRIDRLPPLEVTTATGWYDARSKLDPDADVTSVTCSDLDHRVLERISDESVRVGRLLGVRGAFRVDFVVDEDDAAWALEINTVPGMQPSSNLPDAARRAGIDYDDLVLLLLEGALDDGRACACRGSVPQ